jgi:hypothetical protein
MLEVLNGDNDATKIQELKNLLPSGTESPSNDSSNEVGDKAVGASE